MPWASGRHREDGWKRFNPGQLNGTRFTGHTFLLLSRQIRLQPHHRGVSVNTIHLSRPFLSPSATLTILFSQGARGVSVRRFHAEWWVGVSVCVFGFWCEDVRCRWVSCRTEARGLCELSCFASFPVTFHWQLVSYQQTAHKLSGALIMKISAYQSPHLFLAASRFSLPCAMPYRPSRFPHLWVCASLCEGEWEMVPNAPLLAGHHWYLQSNSACSLFPPVGSPLSLSCFPCLLWIVHRDAVISNLGVINVYVL